MTMDEIAKIYIRNLYGKYRIKIFEKSVGIERQSPREDNVLFERLGYPALYDENDGSWNIDSINILIDRYEAHIADVNATLDAEMN
jgi:hypothetical protein